MRLADALILCIFFLMIPGPPGSSPLSLTTLFRSTLFAPHELTTAGVAAWHEGASFGSCARCWWWRTRSSSPSRRSEEHTSELQSRQYLVCRLLLEKKQDPSTPWSRLSPFIHILHH